MKSYCYSLKEVETSPVAVLTSYLSLPLLPPCSLYIWLNINYYLCWHVNVSSQLAILSVCVCGWVGGGHVLACAYSHNHLNVMGVLIHLQSHIVDTHTPFGDTM